MGRQLDVLQCFAAAECLYSDFSQAAAQSKIRKRFATCKSVIFNMGYIVGDHNMIQESTIAKSRITNGC